MLIDLRTPSRAHPRSRGENVIAPVMLDRRLGSSPLTRGKRADRHDSQADGGLIPAHAGKTSAPICVMIGSRAHPRSRGENLRK